MIVLTGGAGFIGSCMLARLNQEGMDDVLVVDSRPRDHLRGKRYRGFLQKEDFLRKIRRGGLKGKVEAVVHMGACSSTTETDAAYLLANNTGYSIHVALWALEKRARLIYASSAATYGAGERGYSDDPSRLHWLRPLNLYGWSKQFFDLWVLRQGLADKVLGLKFFNVYGPNEAHKGEMRSLVHKAYGQVLRTGSIRLFKSYRPGVPHGEQTRDFIYVKDCCEVMLRALRRPSLNGIYNLGTGKARSWNDLAAAVFRALGRRPRVRYVDMPAAIRGSYQYHTQADMSRFRRAFGPYRFYSLEEGVADYMSQHLLPGKSW